MRQIHIIFIYKHIRIFTIICHPMPAIGHHIIALRQAAVEILRVGNSLLHTIGMERCLFPCTYPLSAHSTHVCNIGSIRQQLADMYRCSGSALCLCVSDGLRSRCHDIVVADYVLESRPRERCRGSGYAGDIQILHIGTGLPAN